MEDLENFYQQATRLQSFDFCPLTLTPTQKCTLARKAFLYRTSTNLIVCIKCRDAFDFESFEVTSRHECGATSSSNTWEDLNIPIPSPCTEANENLASETYRLETFVNYPLTPSLSNAEELASNGFYFDKTPEHIKCYSCGFGLAFNDFNATYAIKAHGTFSVSCEPRESDQNHTVSNFLNSEGGKYLLEAGYVRNSIKSIVKKRLSNNQPLTVEEITQDLVAIRSKAKEEEALINTIENFSINNPDENPADTGVLVMDLLNQAQIENETLKDSKLCKICLTVDVAMAFVPCGHFICCEACSSTLQSCPMCRVNIEKTLKIYQ